MYMTVMILLQASCGGHILFLPLCLFQALCKYISHTTIDIGMGKEIVVRPKELVSSAQYFILHLLNAGFLHDFELLNLDMLNNAVAALKQFSAVYYEVCVEI